MSMALYVDVHVPRAVTDQLLRRNVDVITATDDKMAEAPDDQLLDHVTGLGRLIITFDIRFKGDGGELATHRTPFQRLGLCASDACLDRRTRSRFGINCQVDGSE